MYKHSKKLRLMGGEKVGGGETSGTSKFEFGIGKVRVFACETVYSYTTSATSG
jgi:hypothetical protein